MLGFPCTVCQGTKNSYSYNFAKADDGVYDLQYKVWIKTGAEMSFLYGNNVTKAGLARITDGTPQYGGVIIYSMSDIPLGFGIAAQPTEYCRDLEPNANVVCRKRSF